MLLWAQCRILAEGWEMLGSDKGWWWGLWLPLERSWQQGCPVTGAWGAVTHGMVWQDSTHACGVLCVLSSCMDPQTGFGSFTAVLCLFLCFWQVVIHPRMKLKMMLSKLLYVHIFLFMLVQATVHKKAWQLRVKWKDSKPQLVLLALGLGGGGQVDWPLLHRHKDGTEGKGWFIGTRAPSLWLIHQINNAEGFFPRVLGLYWIMPKSSRSDSPALKLNKLDSDVFSPMSSCRRDKQKSTGFTSIIMAWR